VFVGAGTFQVPGGAFFNPNSYNFYINGDVSGRLFFLDGTDAKLGIGSDVGVTFTTDTNSTIERITTVRVSASAVLRATWTDGSGTLTVSSASDVSFNSVLDIVSSPLPGGSVSTSDNGIVRT